MSNIIDYSEILKMKAAVESRAEDRSSVERKAYLKKLSQDKVKNWPNTLEALRKRKEMFMKDKADQEELRRQEIDRQESEIRKAKRLEAIERANELLYSQTDKMKVLTSQALYADVIHERKSQIEAKRKVVEEEKIIEQHHHENILREVKRLEGVEEDKIRQRKEVVQAVIKTREDQLDEIRERRAKQKQQEVQRGIEMKREAQRQLEESFEAQRAHAAAVARSNAEMVVANQKLKEYKDEIALKERLAMEARDAEVEVIDARKKALKALEIRRFEKSQETRQKLIDAAVEQLAKKVNTDAAVLQKQEDEIRDREDKVAADKAAKLAKQKSDIALSREEQMRMRDTLLRERREEEERMIKSWRESNEIEIQKEKDKIKKEKELVAQLKAIQLSEAQEKQRKKVEDRVAQLEQENFLLTLKGLDDKKFVDRCKAKITEYANAGKPVYTLLRALETTPVELIPAKVTKKEK